MPIDSQLNPVAAESLARKHESRNPPISGILLSAGSVVLMVAACLAITWFVLGRFWRGHPRDNAMAARGIVIAPNFELLKRFPAPNLQITPHDDLAALRAREDAELNGYGWVDRPRGIVRIPIERAMDLLAERGLPARTTNAPPRTGESRVELIRDRSQKR